MQAHSHSIFGLGAAFKVAHDFVMEDSDILEMLKTGRF